ncbi:MAG: hypothetical protein M3N19_09685 [Candidatus Eremiobacteraeota bacterium]|nr:hypothetical protein [Candidatus Eremiobacteraeota bacterium]
MFSYLLLSAALSVAALPAPAASPASTPLTEIGHVKATASCAALATHANSAISSTLNNDLLISQTINDLRKVDLDLNGVSRMRGMNLLGNYARDLKAQALAGINEVKKLRELANASTDPEQQKALKAFADELGGALYRQKKVAMDMNGMLATFDKNEMLRPTAGEAGMGQMSEGTNDGALPKDFVLRSTGGSRTNPISAPGRQGLRAPASDTILAQYAATDFQTRIPEISNDEALAANYVAAAVSGC